jgi:NAD(P)-dependent dehydrogenase (short-subunit alcohol dehydrogenase family)
VADLPLDGCVALVTGSTRGLGRVIVEDLVARGARVVVHGRTREAAADIAHQVGAALAVAGDLSQGPDAAAAVVAEVEEGLGPVALLVNNAADQGATSLADAGPEAWRGIVDVTLLAAVELTRLVCRPGPGSAATSVVNIASVEAFAPFPGHAAYAASKAALVSFTASAALAYAPVRVNAVAPGLVDRPGLAEQWPEGFDWWGRTTALGRPVQAREVAAAVAFLLSPDASGITGATLPVDGGWTSSARAAWGHRDG